MAKRVKLSDQVRLAVNSCGKSRYRICKELGISQSTFSRFMAGKTGIGIENLDALADLLGLDIMASGEPAAVKGNERQGRKRQGKVTK